MWGCRPTPLPKTQPGGKSGFHDLLNEKSLTSSPPTFTSSTALGFLSKLGRGGYRTVVSHPVPPNQTVGPLPFLGWIVGKAESEGQRIIGKTRKERGNHHRSVLPGQRKVWIMEKYHINVNSEIYVWSPDISPELYTHISNSLLTISTWMLMRHLTLHFVKWKPNSFLHSYLLYSF